MTYAATVAQMLERVTPSTFVRVGDFGGRIRTLQGNLTLPAGLAAGSHICIGRLPRGARLLPTSGYMLSAAQGTLTFSVGAVNTRADGQLLSTGLVVDRYGSARTYPTANALVMLDRTLVVGTEITALHGEDITMTTAVAVTTAAELRTFLHFVVD